MRKNTVTSKNRPPQNLTRFPKSRSKYTQTWHHVLKRPPPCINQIKYLHSQQPFYCSSWVKCWTGSTRVVAMLAEIFMVRLEAAARLQQEPASLSSSSFVPFTANNHFL